MTALLGQMVRHGLYGAILIVVMAVQGAFAAPYADLVIDARTGEVLHSENADTRLHPASLTKMMTLYIAFEAIERGEISLDTMVNISNHAAAEPPSKLGLRGGQKIALRYLIRAAAIKSANDAATAIGEAIEGSEAAFARRMTRTAKALGMSRTTFKNANGLTEEGHLSTARDMTTLGRHLFYDYPQYYNLFSRQSADAGIAQVASTNRRFLSAYEGADGIKTGYTSAAGFNLTASAQRGKKRIIATVFGGRSTATRNERVAELLDIGFGKAPNRAKVKKPDMPDYVAQADVPADPLEDSGTDPRATGKTIRVSGSVGKSPRPLPRPGQPPVAPPEEMLVAMQSGIDAALAEVQATAVAAAPPEAPVLVQDTAPQPETLALAAADVAALAPEPRPEVAAPEPAPDATGLALAAASIPVAPEPRPDDIAPIAGDGPILAQLTAPQPESLALASLAPDTAQNAPAQAPSLARQADAPMALVLAEAPSAPTPSAAPAADPAADPVADAIAQALAEALGVSPELAPPPAPEVQLAAIPVPPPRPEALTEALAEAAPTEGQPETLELAALLASPEPRAAVEPAQVQRGPQIVLAAVAATEPLPLEQEIVTRVSTSGGRHFAINVGRYSSRFEAERVLLQTALAEIDTLDEALRKVVNRKGGFDANFSGLSEDGARIACQRLAARGAECTVIGP